MVSYECVQCHAKSNKDNKCEVCNTAPLCNFCKQVHEQNCEGKLITIRPI